MSRISGTCGRRAGILGRKAFAPKLFYRFSLEAQIPEDHLQRRMAAVVDFPFVRRLTTRCSSHTGRSGLDPVVLSKLSLLGSLYGITCECGLAEEVRLHLVYPWFLGYDVDEATPDHSVPSEARALFGVTVPRAFFTEIVRQCRQAGRVRGDRLYVDSTLTAANASLESMGARALVARLAVVDEHLVAVWRANPGGPTEAPPTPQPAGPRPSDPPSPPP